MVTEYVLSLHVWENLIRGQPIKERKLRACEGKGGYWKVASQYGMVLEGKALSWPLFAYQEATQGHEDSDGGLALRLLGCPSALLPGSWSRGLLTLGL